MRWDDFRRSSNIEDERADSGGGGFNADVGVDDDYSDFNPADELDKNGGTPIGTGAITDGTHNLNVDPAFVNQTFGDPAGFNLLATSPVIGAGEPVLLAGESPTDADRNPHDFDVRYVSARVRECGRRNDFCQDRDGV